VGRSLAGRLPGSADFVLIFVRVRLCCGLRWVGAAQAAASFNEHLKIYGRPLVLATKNILVKGKIFVKGT